MCLKKRLFKSLLNGVVLVNTVRGILRQVSTDAPAFAVLLNELRGALTGALTGVRAVDLLSWLP